MYRSNKRFFIALCALAFISLTCSLFSPARQAPETEEVEIQSLPGEIAPVEGESEPVEESAETRVQATKRINAILGGEVSLETASGDLVRLFIPPFALEQETEIRLSALPVPPANPFQGNVFPGVQIEPEGLRLRLPATLAVELAGSAPASVARLFYLKNSDLALPLWQSKVQGGALSGKIFHFSAYTGSAPSAQEAQSQAASAAGLGGDFPADWQGDMEGNQALNEWGNTLNDMGLNDDGSAAIDQAHARLQADLACLMDPNCNVVPLDPCGEYQQMLMQMFEQATLLAFDPESPAMSFLYDELQRVLNECTNRYTLEYNHTLSMNESGFEQEIHVSGQVIFTAPMYGVFETGDPLKMEGSGPVNVTINGQMHVDDETCTIEGSGTNQVTISGQLEADEMGEPWVALQVTENWYTSGSMTFTCPEDDYSETRPLAAMPGQEFPLRFQYEDGAKSMAPNLGGMQGEYIWILHILHTW